MNSPQICGPKALTRNNVCPRDIGERAGLSWMSRLQAWTQAAPPCVPRTGQGLKLKHCHVLWTHLPAWCLRVGLDTSLGAETMSATFSPPGQGQPGSALREKSRPLGLND